MNKSIENYESMPHGTAGLRISVYSERIYGALPHHHEEYCLFYLKRGCLLFGLGDEEFYVRSGDVIFVEPNTPYYIFINENTSQPHEFHYYSVVFDASVFGGEDDLCRRFLSGIHIPPRLTLSADALAKLPLMREWDIKKPIGYELFLKNAIFSIMTEIVASDRYTVVSDKKRTRSELSSDAVRSMVEYIELHYREPLSVEAVAKGAGYSLSHVHRIFKSGTGMSILRYINRYRIEKACLDLIYTDKKITRVAADNGFEHAKHFSEIFRSVMGMSPTRYRETANYWRTFTPSE